MLSLDAPEIWIESSAELIVGGSVEQILPVEVRGVTDPIDGANDRIKLNLIRLFFPNRRACCPRWRIRPTWRH